MPVNSSDTRMVWSRFGAYSVVSATTLGSAPPSPNPVRKRRASSSSRVPARVVASEKRPKVAVAPTITHLRPTLSARGPRTPAPHIRPTRPATNTGAKDGSGTCMASEIAGARKPMLCVSKPSSTAIEAHRAMVTIWNGLMGLESMKSAAVIPFVCAVIASLPCSLVQAA